MGSMQVFSALVDGYLRMYQVHVEAEIGGSPVSNYSITLAWVWIMSAVGRCGTGRSNPSRETRFSGANGDRGNIVYLFS